MLYVIIGSIVGLTLLALLLRAQQGLEKTASEESRKEITDLKASMALLVKRIETLETIAVEGEAQLLDNVPGLLSEKAEDEDAELDALSSANKNRGQVRN